MSQTKDEPCALCSALASGPSHEGFVGALGHVSLYRGPLAFLFPGAVQAVFREHVCELSDVFPYDVPSTQLELLDVEKALRAVTGCARINVAKFGNQVPHLHWHIIPRYAWEKYPTQNPWELSHHYFASMVREEFLPKAIQLAGDADVLYARLFARARDLLREREPSTFSAAFFLRPTDPGRRAQFLGASARTLAEAARTDGAEAWQCLIMKRNYRDRSWDHIGGRASAAEFPGATLRREVSEETGWRVSDELPVLRQWQGSLIRGFLSVVVPEGDRWMDDDAPFAQNDEVAELRYFALSDLAADATFPHRVRARTRAFLERAEDVSLDSEEAESKG